MATWLWRPNKRLQMKIEEKKKRLGLDLEENQPVLALHVRHGDSCLATEEMRMGRTCSPLSDYMEPALRMINNYGYKSIYLMTDDPKVIQETKEYPQVKWIYDTKPRSSIIDVSTFKVS